MRHARLLLTNLNLRTAPTSHFGIVGCDFAAQERGRRRLAFRLIARQLIARDFVEAIDDLLQGVDEAAGVEGCVIEALAAVGGHAGVVVVSVWLWSGHYSGRLAFGEVLSK